MNKKGFTLVELLAVIVILAIIALITIPIVIKTINNSQEESEKQSIIGYARVLENDIANYLLDPKNKLTDYQIPDNLDYKGNNVFCDKPDLSTNKLKLTNCYVSDKKLSDEEKAKKNLYDYDNGKVTKVSKSEDGSGEDSTPYEAYSTGNSITVAGEQYYVIYDSPKTQDYVTALKAEPLTITELNELGSGNINRNIIEYNGNASDISGYGGMAFYTNDNCSNIIDEDEYRKCTSNYLQSDVIVVLNRWSETKFDFNALKEIDGYKVRLIKVNEVAKYLDNCNLRQPSCSKSDREPSWLYNIAFSYWMMDQCESYPGNMWTVDNTGLISCMGVSNVDHIHGAVRPVINVYKNKIGS